MLSTFLIASSATVVLALGSIHLIYTFATNKFSPRGADVAQQMQETSPVISGQTTMWRAWIGFNASHSLGAMLFGALYGYLAVVQPRLLFQSVFLFATGAVFLGSFLALARAYWFRIPFVGICIALVLYASGFAVSLA